MPSREIRLREIKASQLEEFANTAIAAAGRHGLVPITPQRALAHATNPYADPDDVALIVAYSGDACAGYFGILPGRLKTATGIHKVYWGTTWYVDPRHRGDGTALRLIQAARSLHYDLIATDLSDAALRVFKAIGCVEFGPLPYFKLRLSRELPLVAAPFRLLRRVAKAVTVSPKWLDAAIRWVDTFSSCVHRHRLHRRLDKLTAPMFYDAYYKVAHEPLAPGPVIESSEIPCFHRGPELIEWMLKYKWVLAEHDNSAVQLHYQFSNVRKAFAFLQVSLFNRSMRQHMGIVLLSLSQDTRTVLKVLDSSPALSPSLALGAVLHVAADLRADTVVLPEPLAGPLVDAGINGVDLERVMRRYICVSASPDGPLSAAIENLRLNHCDGDSAFV